MTGDRPVLVGLLFYTLVALAPTMIVWAAVRLIPVAFRQVLDRRARRRVPPGPSLETVVASLRRLRGEMRNRPPTTQVRRLALLTAYDETLLQLCALIGVDGPLATATGSDRAFARLLTEAAVEDAGIALDPPSGSTAAA